MFPLFSKSSDKKAPSGPVVTIPVQRKKRLAELCKKLGITLKDFVLLDTALAHSSSVDKGPGARESYERLEFLGDSVLNTSMAYLLYHNNPEYTEGALSALRSSLVDEKTLSEIAFSFHILHYIKLGKGETLSDSRAKEKVAADVMESIIGVIFLEKGFDKALAFVRRVMEKEIQKRILVGTRDYKTQIQKWAVSRYKEYPSYEVVSEKGPDHNKIFEVRVRIHNEYSATATGRTKKDAEQKAAEKVLQELKSKDLLK
jgi:ribonuclease III